ncbi:D-inositol-3-phosphate glycosyltransferase [Mangrovactinospora gilvigrisea]|uniref:D-inositol-3-phosphate glycosyltransferase n=1 Tax=Mangrovactinospora gilvigrisea TaxID=1428644 RepID=A0A1J7BGK4_9ACTN|nr:D-inositol-3-phosphate glycosyltransferase [Mangrovactinospora gilvigrisea]
MPHDRHRATAIRRIAMLSVHTSPLHQPGTGDAGGMNVYIVQLARHLAARGIEVEIFTRATSGAQPPLVRLEDGVLVRHVEAGPYEGLRKEDLSAQLCAFTHGVLAAEAARDIGHYDLVHSHYWLSGQVGWLAAERWGVPLVHSMHTMAKVKNAHLAAGDTPEPAVRVIGEQQVVDASDRLIANTEAEAAELERHYSADPSRVAVVHPGADLDLFNPGRGRADARARLGLPGDAAVLLFAGRIQPLKGPDVLLRAAARLVEADPALRARLIVPVIGGPSGSGASRPAWLHRLADRLGIADLVRFLPAAPQERLADWFRAATALVMPSYNESFGLTAIEAQACGTPVVATAVGGLSVAVSDGRTGLLVPGHDPDAWAAALGRLARDPGLVERMGSAAALRALRFGWSAAAEATAEVYADAAAARSAVAWARSLRP